MGGWVGWGGRWGGCVGLKRCVPANTRFAGLILSRAGLTAARDKINPAKRMLVWSTQKGAAGCMRRCMRGCMRECMRGCRRGVISSKVLQAAYFHGSIAAGPAYFRASSAARTGASDRGDGPGPATREPTARPPLSRGRADPSASGCSYTGSTTHSATPTPGVEPTSRGRCGPVQTGAPGAGAVEGGF